MLTLIKKFACKLCRHFYNPGRQQLNHGGKTMSQSNAARSDDADEQPRTGRRPEHTAKVGNVEIAVWKNQGANGDFFTASSPVIRYKDGTSGEFKDGSSYGQLDLLALAEAAREASAKIRELSKGRAQGR
jgi:hypothetical protein